MNWTNPYCGVSHAELESGQRVQLTVVDNQTFVEAFCFDFRSRKPFTPTSWVFPAGQIIEAQQWLEGLLPK